ncbi:unnamed protein product [Eruca vesicaria subsp. sativa]|uniref:Zinc finger GRF-type domain-containing protein n=1 Tax=Eruca vesicaria subsp. sativa TaxID=29727 RepID=A0ABC8M967_ERUVS|nr:unnamed protein product [Eruca vesicaria subsp. sativa]
MEVGSSSRGRNSGRRRCHCGLPAAISQAWTDKNPGRRFYGCPRFKRGNECKGRHKMAKKALIEARDEIREKNRVIEELKKTILEMRNDEIVRQFEQFQL